MTVDDGRGGEAQRLWRIAIAEPPPGNVPPTAEAGLPDQGGVGDTIRLDGGGAHDLNGDALAYAWDFGDGSAGTGASPTTSI